MGNQRAARLSATLKATILSGQSLSDIIELGDFALSAIIMPGTWTDAALTFVAVEANTNFNAYDDSGTEVSIANTTAQASRALVNKAILEQLSAFRRFRIRSGTSGTPVNQGADRVLTVLVKS